ncbi:Uncharacterised protein [Shigella sonnei]|nr:Uncharacterised protein [Shigella sonnei]
MCHKRAFIVSNNAFFRVVKCDMAQYAAKSQLQVLGCKSGVCRPACQDGAFDHDRIIAKCRD